MEFPPGTLLDGRYRIGEVLGSGGMSVVYAAEDLRLSRQVAIKVVKGSEDETLAERLFREARAAAMANHPAVATVYSHGTDAETGLGYLAMERLYGEDLASRISRAGPLPGPLIRRIGVEVADALVSVHECGTVHRDLKPTNIFLGRRGRREDEVRVLDFGVAKHLDLWTLTKPGTLLGTLCYMAPEQLLADRVDPRSDLYSLGIVLFECASGRRAFSAANISQLAQQLTTEKATPSHSLRPDLPLSLCTIIDRCMARKPENRFQDAAQVRDALLTVTFPAETVNE